MGARPVKILQIVIGGKTFSGVASYLYQQYKHIDREAIQYDFLFCKENSLELRMREPTFIKSKFIVLNARRKNGSNDYFKIYSGVKHILKDGEYDAIVVNTSVVAIIAVCLMARNSIDTSCNFIAHAHNTEIIIRHNAIRSRVRFLIEPVDKLLRRYIRRHATYLFACSELAGEVTFGKAAVYKGNFKIIRDAIDVSKFRFNSNIRKNVREREKLSDDIFVYGNVGKLSERKNQKFLVDVFNEIHKENMSSVLWLIGDGVDKEMLMQHIEELNLQDYVKFFGQRSDVNELMQGMDSFVFTTLSEGLGIVAIEAQAAGLLTTVSDGCPEDVLLTDIIQRIPLSESAEVWAKIILHQEVAALERLDVSQVIADAGYDISVEAMRMEEFYLSLCQR